MKFIVPSSLLLEHLQMVSGAIVSKPVLPILENFLFDISKGELTIHSTDLETSMSTTIKVEAKEDIKVAVPSKMTLEILRSLPDQPVTFTVNEDTFAIEMSTSFGRYKLAGQPGNDYPKLPEVDAESTFTLSSNILLRAISKSIFATGTDDLRLNLTGVYVEMSEGSINFVATDANRLVRITRDDVKPGVENNFILPKKALNLLKSSLSNDVAPVRVDYNKSNVFFTLGDMKLTCRMIDERYPDYKAVIPSDNNNHLTINRIELLNSVRRISIFSNKTTHQIRLKITGNELNISAEDLEMANEAQERLNCEYDGEDLEIGFNSRFLQDMLANIDHDEVVLQLSTPNRAGLMVPKENETDESVTMLIMPMMLNNY
ncbi:MAG: DNA polymerase III subunit beta [Bacteroidia bacterium]|nr:DNA polymerase III subunit beta [Bacteroidia bacterium]